MRSRLIVAVVLVASLLIAVPAVSASDVADPVMAKLEAIVAALKGVNDETQALSKRVENLEKKTEEMHKAIVGTSDAKPSTIVIKSDGVTPISVTETDDGARYELMELREEGKNLIARIRITTAPKAHSQYYSISLETGVRRETSGFKEHIPAATTREAVLTFKGLAGTLTPQAYFSIAGGGFEVSRVYVVPQK